MFIILVVGILLCVDFLNRNIAKMGQWWHSTHLDIQMALVWFDLGLSELYEIFFCCLHICCTSYFLVLARFIRLTQPDFYFVRSAILWGIVLDVLRHWAPWFLFYVTFYIDLIIVCSLEETSLSVNSQWRARFSLIERTIMWSNTSIWSLPSLFTHVFSMNTITMCVIMITNSNSILICWKYQSCLHNTFFHQSILMKSIQYKDAKSDHWWKIGSKQIVEVLQHQEFLMLFLYFVQLLCCKTREITQKITCAVQ